MFFIFFCATEHKFFIFFCGWKFLKFEKSEKKNLFGERLDAEQSSANQVTHFFVLLQFNNRKKEDTQKERRHAERKKTRRQNDKKLKEKERKREIKRKMRKRKKEPNAARETEREM